MLNVVIFVIQNMLDGKRNVMRYRSHPDPVPILYRFVQRSGYAPDASFRKEQSL